MEGLSHFLPRFNDPIQDENLGECCQKGRCKYELLEGRAQL
jgi:hypothetical protein